MGTSFHPPSIDRLADVDHADCEYGEECVEIQGLVSPTGQCGWPSMGDYSVHCFSFFAWRRIGRPVVNRELAILRPVAPDDDFFAAFSALSIHRISVLLSKDETRAVFANASQVDGQDADLLAIAEELRKPVVVSTSRFGDLLLDRSVHCFEGHAEWNGKRICLSFHTDDSGDITNALETAAALWDAQAEWKRKTEDLAVQELLAVKNELWLGDDEDPVTVDQFKARMNLVSISVSPDGSLSFWHEDGDLFWGHHIAVEGSLSEGPTSAGIHG